MTDATSMLAARLARGLVATVVGLLPVAGRAQEVDLNFPVSGAGYDQQFGETVLTRARPDYDAPGVRLGTIVVRPELDQSIAYDSNPTASPAARSALVLRTAAAASATTDWGLGSAALQAGLEHDAYPTLQDADYTDWNVGAQASEMLGDGLLSAAYAHQAYHQLGAAIGTVRSQTPTSDSTDTGRLSYTHTFAAFDLTPDVSVSSYHYGVATTGGVRTDQAYLDRRVIAGGLTARIGINQAGGVVIAAQIVDAEYPTRLAGEPSNTSRSYALLAGVDYQAEGPWRYRVLVGGEVSSFDAPQYATRVSPVVEASAIWTPTRLTTLTGTLRRAISDPQAAGTNGYVLTQPSLQLDHELLRNVLLHLHATGQFAEYLQSGSQTGLGFGGGADWLLNRNIRLSLTYNFYHQGGSDIGLAGRPPNAPDTSGFTEQVLGISLKLAL